MSSILTARSDHYVSQSEPFLAPSRVERAREVLTREALGLLMNLHARFDQRRLALLAERQVRQRAFDAGELPDFLASTADIRRADWRIAPPPRDLADRRVEITGPTERKLVINALNSDANTFMADFEDSCSPTWDNLLRGQVNLADAVHRRIEFTDVRGRDYRLNARTATLMVRPAAGICRRNTSESTGSRSAGRCSISHSIWPTTMRRWRVPVPRLTSIFPSSRAISKRVCGTMCSWPRKTIWEFPGARFARPS